MLSYMGECNDCACPYYINECLNDDFMCDCNTCYESDCDTCSYICGECFCPYDSIQENDSCICKDSKK